MERTRRLSDWSPGTGRLFFQKKPDLAVLAAVSLGTLPRAGTCAHRFPFPRPVSQPGPPALACGATPCGPDWPPQLAWYPRCPALDPPHLPARSRSREFQAAESALASERAGNLLALDPGQVFCAHRAGWDQRGTGSARPPRAARPHLCTHCAGQGADARDPRRGPGLPAGAASESPVSAPPVGSADPWNEGEATSPAQPVPTASWVSSAWRGRGEG